MKPIIIINFKTVENTIGEKALKLAKICEDVANKTKTEILIAPQIADIYRIARSVKIKVAVILG